MSRETNNEPAPSSRLTIIVIRKFGRISSYEFSKYWITFFVLFFVFLIAAVGWLAYQNRDLTAERQRLLAQLILTPMDVVSTQPPAPTTVEEPVVTTEIPPTTMIVAAAVEEKERVAPSSEKRRVVMTETTTTTRPTTTTTTTAPTNTTSTTQPVRAADSRYDIKIDEFSIVRLGSPNGLKLRYKIVNLGAVKATGYTFIVAKDESQSPPVYAPYPREAILSMDRPVNYKQGIQYSIQRFKTIRGRIYSNASLSEVEILVYDSQGDLLLNKTYEVPDV